MVVSCNLVKENKDGSRPGYRGEGAYQSGSGAPGSAESKGMGGSGSNYSGNGGYTSPSNPTGTLTGDDYRSSKKAFDIGVFEPKEIPAYGTGRYSC